MAENIEARLRQLGVAESNITDYVQMLTGVSSVESLKAEAITRHYQCSIEQYLRPMFAKVCAKNPELITRFESELSDFNIPPELVHKFLTEMGNNASLIFSWTYSKQVPPSENREKFFRTAEQLMLKSIREYIGVG